MPLQSLNARPTQKLHTGAFGNAALLVIANDLAEACVVRELLEGNLTGCIYSATRGEDEDAYGELEPRLRPAGGTIAQR